ncbi:MAG: hypothetical protein U5K56_02585 [Halioglobus sp.]|nr:hypothetical protein [Halioglobus sp.]
MKKTVSKADIRRELHRQTEHFLRGGGEVKEVPRGLSGREPGDPPVFLNHKLFIEPRAPRTLVPEVVAAIESRRKEASGRKPRPKDKRARRPRRETIYDDFGEPLRRIWVED